MPTATWTALVTDIYAATNRPDLVAETAFNLKLALKGAHRQNKFWRDLVTVSLPNMGTDQVQSVTLSADVPDFNQLCYLKAPAGTYSQDIYFEEAEARDLLDEWKAPKTNVYWGIGDTLNIRAATPVDTYELCYYKKINTNPETLAADWLIESYSEVPVLLAASTVLATLGEQEIKTRIDQLLSLAISQLVADQVEVAGR